MPCSEGCEECEDGSPCVYKLKITPRVILITIDGIAALLALVFGAMVLIFRESKVILFVEIASTVLVYPVHINLISKCYFTFFLEKKNPGDSGWSQVGMQI